MLPTIFTQIALQLLDLLDFGIECLFLGTRLSSNACVRLGKFSELVGLSQLPLGSFFGLLCLLGHLAWLLCRVLSGNAVLTLCFWQLWGHGLHFCEGLVQQGKQTALVRLEFGKILLYVLKIDGLRVSLLCCTRLLRVSFLRCASLLGVFFLRCTLLRFAALGIGGVFLKVWPEIRSAVILRGIILLAIIFDSASVRRSALKLVGKKHRLNIFLHLGCRYGGWYLNASFSRTIEE